MMRLAEPAREDSVESDVWVEMGSLDADLPDLVKQLLDPVFVLFDFSEFEDLRYQEVVGAFQEGGVT